MFSFAATYRVLRVQLPDGDESALTARLGMVSFDRIMAGRDYQSHYATFKRLQGQDEVEFYPEPFERVVISLDQRQDRLKVLIYTDR